MSCRLIIYGAAYGRDDVTEIVKGLITNEQKLKVTASNDEFTDTWRRHEKTLVVVYEYENTSGSEIKTVIVKEGNTVELSSPTAAEGLGGNIPERGQDLKLEILGAVYGTKNVTSAAKEFVKDNQEFDQMATNKVWGDGWRGYKKTLVVVYTYNNIFMIDIVVEGKKMHIIASPPLRILGASYGLKCVTEKVKQLVKERNGSFSLKADNKTLGDGWRGHKKSLVIVYQYGDQEPAVATAKEGKRLGLLYSKKARFSCSEDCTNLTILGAAYGPKDVTDKVQSLVEARSALDIEAVNSVFGNTWWGYKKSLVIVYCYGSSNMPRITIIEEDKGFQVQH